MAELTSDHSEDAVNKEIETSLGTEKDISVVDLEASDAKDIDGEESDDSTRKEIDELESDVIDDEKSVDANESNENSDIDENATNVYMYDCDESDHGIRNDVDRPRIQSTSFAMYSDNTDYESATYTINDDERDLENDHDSSMLAELGTVIDIEEEAVHAYVDCETEEQEDIQYELQCACAQAEIDIGELQLELHKLQQENAQLHHENVELKNAVKEQGFLHNITNSLVLQIKQLQLQLNRVAVKFGADFIKDDDTKTCFYTGLPSYQLFHGLFDLLYPVMSENSRKTPHSLLDELFIVLVKLRLGIPYDDLAYRMDVSDSYISTIFHKWIDVMSTELRCLIAWPDDFTLRENMPKSFQKHFSNVKCIIDCFEIFIERPVSFQARAATYSNYKKHNTVKVLIAVTPTGSICFISKAWGGRVSDKVITQKCGFLDHIQRGDVVLADRGFNVRDDLAIAGAYLKIPAFTKGKSQLSQKEVETTRQLARVRIHVERVIGQLRKKYKILSNTLPISLIKCPTDSDKCNCTIDRILIVTAALTNLSPSIVTN